MCGIFSNPLIIQLYWTIWLFFFFCFFFYLRKFSPKKIQFALNNCLFWFLLILVDVASLVFRQSWIIEAMILVLLLIVLKVLLVVLLLVLLLVVTIIIRFSSSYFVVEKWYGTFRSLVTQKRVYTQRISRKSPIHQVIKIFCNDLMTYGIY